MMKNHDPIFSLFLKQILNKKIEHVFLFILETLQIPECHDYGQCLIPPELTESQAESRTDSRTPGLPSLRPPRKLDVKLVKQIL